MSADGSWNVTMNTPMGAQKATPRAEDRRRQADGRNERPARRAGSQRRQGRGRHADLVGEHDATDADQARVHRQGGRRQDRGLASSSARSATRRSKVPAPNDAIEVRRADRAAHLRFTLSCASTRFRRRLAAIRSSGRVNDVFQLGCVRGRSSRRRAVPRNAHRRPCDDFEPRRADSLVQRCHVVGRLPAIAVEDRAVRVHARHAAFVARVRRCARCSRVAPAATMLGNNGCIRHFCRCRRTERRSFLCDVVVFESSSVCSGGPFFQS